MRIIESVAGELVRRAEAGLKLHLKVNNEGRRLGVDKEIRRLTRLGCLGVAHQPSIKEKSKIKAEVRIEDMFSGERESGVGVK